MAAVAEGRGVGLHGPCDQPCQVVIDPNWQKQLQMLQLEMLGSRAQSSLHEHAKPLVLGGIRPKLVAGPVLVGGVFRHRRVFPLFDDEQVRVERVK